MFKLDSYESFTKSSLKSCIDIFERIIVVLKYRDVICKKTSYVLLYLQQRGKLPDKIPDDKLDAYLLAFRRLYLSNLEESIVESDSNLLLIFIKLGKLKLIQ
jgi:hypothetical protein